MFPSPPKNVSVVLALSCRIYHDQTRRSGLLPLSESRPTSSISFSLHIRTHTWSNRHPHVHVRGMKGQQETSTQRNLTQTSLSYHILLPQKLREQHSRCTSICVCLCVVSKLQRQCHIGPKKNSLLVVPRVLLM